MRTRALYAAAGFITLVPDIAPDLKDGTGGVSRYRFDAPHAQDIGAMVAWLRSRTSKVAVVGTSRGSISAANAAIRLSGPRRPDAIVITSPYLHPPDHREGHVRKIAGDDPKRLSPLYVLVHEKDGCEGTSPKALAGFKTWYEASGRSLTSLALTGGGPGSGDPCEANSPHGFVGLDGKVVDIVTDWIKRN